MFILFSNNQLKVEELLTIITVTKNNDSELIKTLKSIDKQKFMPYEIGHISKDGHERQKPNLLINLNYKLNIYLKMIKAYMML